MDRPDWSPATVGRSAAVGLWTWTAFSLLGASVYVAVANEMPGAVSVPFPTSFVDAFLSVLALGFGESIRFRDPVWTILTERAGETVLLIGATAVVTGGLVASLASLAAVSERWRRAVAVLGYAAALPAMTWLFGLRWVADALGQPVVGVGQAGPVSYWPAILALSLPLGALAARVVGRDGGDRWIDAWLFFSWLFGAVAFVESTLGLRGIGAALIEGVSARDPPLLVGTAGVLVLVAALASVVRELVLEGGGSLGPSLRETEAASGRTDGAGSVDPRSALVRHGRIQVGLSGLGAVAVAAALGRAFVDTDAEMLGSDPLALALGGLSTVTGTAIVAAVVAGAVGVASGVFVDRVRSGRAVLEAVLGYAANVPFLLLLVVLLVSDLPNDAGVVLGLAVAPLVARTAARDLRDRASVAPGALLPALGVAAVGAGVAALVVGQYHALGLTAEVALAPDPSALGGTAFRATVAVAPPAVAFFVLGDGLRNARVDGTASA